MPAFVLILRGGVGKFDDGRNSVLGTRFSRLDTGCSFLVSRHSELVFDIG